MVSYRELLRTVEAALLAGPHLPHEQRAEVAHLLHVSMPGFQSFLQYPVPNTSDRSQVLKKEVRLPNTPPTPLDDQDVQIALKLSDDLHLNELECVRLLINAHQEWNLLEREPLEILRLTSGLWFTERRTLITILQLLLRAVVLDEDLDPDLVADIKQFVESLFNLGLRQKLVTLVKDLSREEPAGCGGPVVEQYVLDARGTLVKRSSVALRERLNLCQCLVFSCLILRMGTQEMKDLFSLLQDSVRSLAGSQAITNFQIAHTILFAILIALMSDALSGSEEMPSVLSLDSTFRREFHEQIMESVNDEVVGGFNGVVGLAWAVFLMLTSSTVVSGLTIPSSTSTPNYNISSVLERACEQNAFKFLIEKIIKTPAFENDDEDMVFMYCAYLHKLVIGFLSQPFGRDKVKEMRDSAMISLDAHYYDLTYSSMKNDSQFQQHQASVGRTQLFVSLLDFIAVVYEQQPELVVENDVLWNFVRFAGEDHTSYVTLAAFLRMLTALASTEESARKVFILLQNKASRSVGWSTLFNTLNIYEQHFMQSTRSGGSLLAPFQEGDARALEAYLRVLKKVMDKGSKMERSQWFPDIEPLFKLLPFENVPPYLKGALRDAIATFVDISPVLREKIWALLEQYDLPMVAGSAAAEYSTQKHPVRVYDMAFELNEVEARHEEYPSTLSYIRLVNTLISCETEFADKGLRFLGIFRFVRDHVFACYSQRAYSSIAEKWQLLIACLKHFHMMLNLFTPSNDDIRSQVKTFAESQVDLSLHTMTTVGQAVEVPTIEVMKDLMSGKTIFRNLMNILMIGVNTVSDERVNQHYGLYLEEAVHMSLELLVLGLNKDTAYADLLRPVYQPLDVVLGLDKHQIVALLEYVRYDALPSIQICSIQMMMMLSSRMPRLVHIILEAGIGDSLIEDYAVCLEARSQDHQAPENAKEDAGFLILQLLISNVNRPAPNITQLLLKFDVHGPLERSILQPKRHYSCLRVLLNVLDTLTKPDVNAVLHELGFQLFYELCVDNITSGAVIELLMTEKYRFFAKHLSSFACEALPKRKTSQILRTSSLQQRAWLLKLLALQLHVSDMDILTQRQSCQQLLSMLFTEGAGIFDGQRHAMVVFQGPTQAQVTDLGLFRIKALELLDIIQFQPPDVGLELPWVLEAIKDELMVGEILGRAATVEDGGVYYFSERGDRLIDLTAFREKLWQAYKHLEVQQNLSADGSRQTVLREAVQDLIRWGWRFNRNVEEQAAQLHMLVGWSQIIEVGISRRFMLLDHHMQILLEILHASLAATMSPDCSLKMSLPLSQVIMTCTAKLQELSFMCPSGDSTDDVTYMDLLSAVRLSNSACQTIFSKLLASIVRDKSSEALRRRQYATLICYLHYCRGSIDPDIPLLDMSSLLAEANDGLDDHALEHVGRDQSELLQMNTAVLKSQATALVDVMVKDITQGSEMGKTMAIYALDALLGVDTYQTILSQVQSMGLLQTCLLDISTNSYQAVLLPSPSSVRRLYTIEAELALLLRVGSQNKKRGVQTLFGMGTVQQLTSCRTIDVQLLEDVRWEQFLLSDRGLPSEYERHHLIVIPVMRLVSCLATLIEDDNKDQGGGEVALEIIEFIKAHHGLWFRILRDDRMGVQLPNLEELCLVTEITCKVWHLVKVDDLGIQQALFHLMSVYFRLDRESRNQYVTYIRESKKLPTLAPGMQEITRKLEVFLARLRRHLTSFLLTLVHKKGIRLHFSNAAISAEPLSVGHLSLGRHKHPTLKLVANLLEQCVFDLASATDEKSLLLGKVQDINELSRHEVDDIIKAYSRFEHCGDSDSLRKRRYIAMVEMYSAAGNRESLVTEYYYIIQHALNILYIHFERELQVREQVKTAVEDMDIDSYFGTSQEHHSFNEILLPSLQHLERINEERTGRGDKQIQRLVRTLKSRIVLSLD